MPQLFLGKSSVSWCGRVKMKWAGPSGEHALGSNTPICHLSRKTVWRGIQERKAIFFKTLGQVLLIPQGRALADPLPPNTQRSSLDQGISITWKLVRKAASWVPAQMPDSRNSGVGPNSSGLIRSGNPSTRWCGRTRTYLWNWAYVILSAYMFGCMYT